jgi:hypothetical protein
MAPIPALALATLPASLPLLIAASRSASDLAAEMGRAGRIGAGQPGARAGADDLCDRPSPPLVVGIALLIQPIVAGTVGWIAYGERLGLADFIGAVLVAIALVLVRAGGPRVASDEELKSA